MLHIGLIIPKDFISHRTMNIRVTVDEILRSPQLRESLENTVRSLNTRSQVSHSEATTLGVSPVPTVPVAISPSTSIRSELNNLFPSIRRGRRTLQRRRNNEQSSTNKLFYEDVILVPFTNCHSTLKGVEKAKAYKHSKFR